VDRIGKLANIAYVRQPVPLGDGDAILRARPFVGDEPFLVLFGDDLVRGETPAARQLMDAYERTGSSVIALEEIADSQVSSYGVVEGEPTGDGLVRVGRFLEKPKPADTASRLGVIGKYVVTPDVFDALSRSERGRDGELRLANAFAIMAAESAVHGLSIAGERYDTGDKLGFLRATVDFALAREDLGAEFRNFLEKRLAR
jgi:UTP--glucose-1-phosphate uridylyltransferase